MKKLILFICSFFLAIGVYAQGGSRTQTAQIQQLQEWSTQPRILNETDTDDIDGSPFYNEDWTEGYVIVDENSTSSKVQLKYSSYTNEVLFVEDGKQAMALPPKALKGFVLTGGDSEVTFKNGYSSNEQDISSIQLMRVIYEGEIQLLAKEYVKLHTSKDPFSGNVEYTFFDGTDFFVRTSDGNFHKVKLKDNDILKALGSHQDELKQYADDNDLNFGDESDLNQILSQYDKMAGSM